ncbi:MAG: DUF6125 family protein [Chloroflexi bacterium]|nr:DUF6125 family protein [Chloroflexota bacterium]
MEELQDYSGEFRPNLRLQDFSKDALIRFWRSVSDWYGGQCGRWMFLVRERFGSQKALHLGNMMWVYDPKPDCAEVREMVEAMNIRGNDVESLFKCFQVDPGACGIWQDTEFKLVTKNHGIFTVGKCWALEYFEKAKDLEYMQTCCRGWDYYGFAEAAKVINPNMKTTALRLPPRRSPDDIACQWEFKVEEYPRTES